MPRYDYAGAAAHFRAFGGHYESRDNYAAMRSIDAALAARPGHGTYLEHKACLLQRLGHADEAFKMYREARRGKRQADKLTITREQLTPTGMPKERDPGKKERAARNERTRKTFFAKKRGIPVSVRKTMATAIATVALLLVPAISRAQTIEGHVRDRDSGAPVAGIRVEAATGGGSQPLEAISDENGYYILGSATGINDSPRGHDKVRITTNSGRIRVEIKSATPVGAGRLCTTTGQTVSTARFTKVGEGLYRGDFTYDGPRGQLLLFTDGIHPAVKIIPGTMAGSAPAAPTRLKNALAATTEECAFTLGDTAHIARYAPLEATRPIDPEGTTTVDFDLEPLGKAYLWRIFRDPLGRVSTVTTDIIITNNEFNINDTIKNIPSGQAWRDTVPVHLEGTTEYKVTYIPHVTEGEIPLYDTTIIFNLKTEETAQGYDYGKALEQRQKIKGRITTIDPANPEKDEPIEIIDIIIKDSEGNTVDSIRTTNGEYESGPYPAGFSGTMDAHIPTNSPKGIDTLYFGHKNIPIIKESETDHYPTGTGRLVFKEKITNFEDSINYYNIGLIPCYVQDPETKDSAKINPAHLYIMDGNIEWNIAYLREKTINIYFKPTSTYNQWYFEMAKRIERVYGIPMKTKEVEEKINGGFTITSLDTTYLNSIEEKTGLNIEVSGNAGVTETYGGSDPEKTGVRLYTQADVRIRGPPNEEGTVPTVIITEDERELVGRVTSTNEISTTYYKSIMNPITQDTLDTTKMIYDHINYKTIHEYRKKRIKQDKKEKINTGSYTIIPNKDIYTKMNRAEYYNQEKWKNWDSTNIPEYNKKFFK